MIQACYMKTDKNQFPSYMNTIFDIYTIENEWITFQNYNKQYEIVVPTFTVKIQDIIAISFNHEEKEINILLKKEIINSAGKPTSEIYVELPDTLIDTSKSFKKPEIKDQIEHYELFPNTWDKNASAYPANTKYNNSIHKHIIVDLIKQINKDILTYRS